MPELQRRDARIKEQDARIAEQDALIAEQAARIANACWSYGRELSALAEGWMCRRLLETGNVQSSGYRSAGVLRSAAINSFMPGVGLPRAGPLHPALRRQVARIEKKLNTPKTLNPGMALRVTFSLLCRQLLSGLRVCAANRDGVRVAKDIFVCRIVFLEGPEYAGRCYNNQVDALVIRGELDCRRKACRRGAGVAGFAVGSDDAEPEPPIGTFILAGAAIQLGGDLV